MQSPSKRRQNSGIYGDRVDASTALWNLSYSVELTETQKYSTDSFPIYSTTKINNKADLHA